jgi:hypothetical protein
MLDHELSPAARSEGQWWVARSYLELLKVSRER